MFSSWSWSYGVLSMELRKNFSYRLAFWTQSILSVLVHILVAYFLWNSIFAAKGVETIGGYTFNGMILYYVVTAFIFQITCPEFGMVGREIYEGALNKFLLFPVPYFVYKLSGHLATSLLIVLELGVALLLFWVFLPLPPEINISWVNIPMALLSLAFAIHVYFVLSFVLELAAFWMDVVWNLVVMLMFIVSFLGGRMLPLSVFPEWVQTAVSYSPFPYIISFPAQALFGQLSFSAWTFGMGVIFTWALFLSLVTQLVWRRGLKGYTGVGI